MMVAMGGPDERALLERARAGDEGAYQDLIEVHRAELHAHCYRILGSVQDAEDAVQDALLRAWRGLPRFEARSTVLSWLYSITTNAALDIAKQRSRRELPATYGPPAGAGGGPGAPLLESVWLDPHPDWAYPIPDGLASPEAVYERRESLELAFLSALQHLPPLQRAVLVLRDVVGLSTAEVAAALDTTVPAVQSALQRGRATARTRLPQHSQQSTLRRLGDRRISELVSRFCDAVDRGDVRSVVSMLTGDAAWAMPPLPVWYQGTAAIAGFLSGYGFQEAWRSLPTRANGQLAVGGYTRDARLRCWVPSVLHVLTLDGDQICDATGFITSELLSRWGYASDRFVGARVFPRLGLPPALAD
jgi:RNA polymerase sigma-70 factor (ECF subfamily)